MKITIRQSAGLGDIFFCQKIAKKIVELGHEVFWPIYPEYQYAERYILGQITWRCPDGDSTELHLEKASHFLIWRNQDEALNHIMEAKYKYANSAFQIGGWEDWPDYLKILRDYDSEKKLKDTMLGGSKEPYCVTCRHFATNYMGLDIPIKTDLREVEIKKTEGFTLFDWMGLIEDAEEIRIPDSSFPYLVEIMDTTDKLYLYNRNGEPNIRTKGIWRKKWTFMEPTRDELEKQKEEDALFKKAVLK